MAKRRRMVDTSVPEHEEVVGASRGEKRAVNKDRQARLEAVALRLTILTPRALTSLDLGEDIESEVRLLISLSAGQRSALVRQRRRVASLLRPLDLDETERRVEEAAGATAQTRASTDRLERLRRQLLEDGDGVLARLFEEHPELDHQRLRQAVRAARREAEGGSTGRHFKRLFQIMKELGLGGG